MWATIPVSAAATEPEVAWWESYGDPVLTDLVARAARENRDIRIAVQRVRAARAGEAISRSALLPNIGAVANASNTYNGYSGSARQGAPESKSASAGLSVSWEIDLTGRLRAGAAAAAAEAQASEDQARGVRLLGLKLSAVQTGLLREYFAMSTAALVLLAVFMFVLL